MLTQQNQDTVFSDRVPRIGIVCEFAALNGGEHSLLAALEALSNKVEPILLAPGAGPLSERLEPMEIVHIPFTVRSPDGQRRTNSDLIQELTNIVDKNEFDLLHANSLSMCRLLGESGLSAHLPTTGHIRDIMSLSHRAVANLNLLDRLIAVSNATRDHHIAQGVEAERCITLYNGIDVEQFAPSNSPEARDTLRREFGFDKDDFLILTIGQIGLRKGQDILAQAALQIVDAIPQARFVLIGQRHSTKPETIAFDEGVDQAFADDGLSARLHRIGRTNRVAEWMQCADVLVHPANQEPLGRVLLEAAASALAIVATDVGGTSEILKHNKSALLIPSRDPEALARQVIDLAKQSDRRQQLGSAARQTIIDNFLITGRANDLLREWQSVIASRS